MIEVDKEINRVLRQGDCAIIVLDACRYDTFKAIYREYLSGELQPAYSPGSCTIEWLIRTFKGYYSLTYVSGCGFVLSKRDAETKYGIFRARRHFKKIVDCFLHGWDDKLGTVPPQHVTKCALENIDDKMIIHYVQPHFPAIGEPKLLLNEPEVTAKLRMNQLTLDYVKRAYIGNLRLVLEQVKELVKHLPHKSIYVTSDHGQALGEQGIVDHPCRSNLDVLRVVPLLHVST